MPRRSGRITITEIEAAHSACRCLQVPDEDRSTWPRSRLKIVGVIEGKHFDGVVGVLIAVNVILMVIEADASAGCAAHDSSICGPPEIVNILNHVLLGLYAVEATLRLYVYRSRLLFSAWNNLDLFIVMTGFVDLILTDGIVTVPSLQVLRVFRMARLLRVVRLLSLFPELQTFSYGIASALKATSWGFLMIVLTLGVWSLLTVELMSVKSKPEELSEHCDAAFSSVVKATHLFFQLIVAGEGWGECIAPTVHLHPEMFLLFATAVVTMQLGFMNLILTVIVQEVANAHEQNYEQRFREKKTQEIECLEKWRGIMRHIDQDSNGTITKDELKKSYDIYADVRHFLDLLDLDAMDMDKLFDLMDTDHTGGVSQDEFFDTLRMAHSQDMRIGLFSLSLQVSQISQSVQRQVNSSIMEGLHKQVEQKLASERNDILSGVREQLEDVVLSSLHMQLKDRLEKMSRDISWNTSKLSQNTELLEAALSRLGLHRESRVQAPADGRRKKNARRGGSQRSTESSWFCCMTPKDELDAQG